MNGTIQKENLPNHRHTDGKLFPTLQIRIKAGSTAPTPIQIHTRNLEGALYHRMRE
jgi:hypothetical protein